MSIPRYSPNPLWFGMPILDNKEGKLCEYRHYVKLESENARLKAEVERLTKAGDELAEQLHKRGASYEIGFSIHQWQIAKGTEGKEDEQS